MKGAVNVRTMVKDAPGTKVQLLEKDMRELTVRAPLSPVDIRLPGKGNSNSHGARPVY